MGFRIRGYGLTDVGRQRKENEDNFILVPDEGLYVVADGMGGHASGRLASALTITRITEFMCIERKRQGFRWPYATRPDRTYAGNSLANAIKFANERVFIEACKDPAHNGMGTTVAAILNKPSDPMMVLGHVGDSRIYQFRRGRLNLMTEDHSLLNHLLRSGQMTEEQAQSFSRKNVIFRALGLKDHVEVDIMETEKKDGDVYMICSDGLTDLVDDDTIQEVMGNCRSDLKTACETLIKMANHNGGKDNITVLMIYLEAIRDL